ncbi:DNA damage-inducible protein I [Escherichia coli]|nr:DNA damage-inducible protein I [Escherichia coli]
MPAGAIDAPAGELSAVFSMRFLIMKATYRYVMRAANNLSVIGATKEDKQRISEILQKRGKRR